MGTTIVSMPLCGRKRDERDNRSTLSLEMILMLM